MDSEEAVACLISRLPGFAPYVDEHRREYDELLIHPLMGDLGRFYMTAVAGDQDLKARYWSAVEAVAAAGDAMVKNAMAVSLIEWFVWGNQDEQAAVREAEPLQGPVPKGLVEELRE